jgi:hypothetical protein
MIPDRERGYSVEADTLIVHERYQDHAPRAMRTSALGVTNVALQRDMEPVPCEVCFPPPPPKPRAKLAKRYEPLVLGPESKPVIVHADGTIGLTSEPTETVTVTSTED